MTSQHLEAFRRVWKRSLPLYTSLTFIAALVTAFMGVNDNPAGPSGIRAEANKAALRGSIERLICEMREPLPGSTLIAEHLAQSLLVEALRLHLAEHSHKNTGWLFALADKQMRAVIGAMHAEPGRKWTLEALARVAGMLRSSFAVRFKDSVGEPAMDYLTRWRMMVASDRLANGGMSIAVVAPTVGYESESAFGAAFKRVIGTSPRQFAKATAG
jgi:AraC-like DNA-binding protein